MEAINTLQSKEIWIPVLTQVLLFAALYAQQMRIGEKIKLEYAKQSIVYQLNQTEYIKQKFDRINKLFTLILQNKLFVEQDAPKFINNLNNVDIKAESVNAKSLRELLRESLMNSSFYINKETRDVITEYVDTCERLVDDAKSWATNQIVLNLRYQMINQSTDADLDDLKKREKARDNYLASFREHSLKGNQLFNKIESSLKQHLDV